MTTFTRRRQRKIVNGADHVNYVLFNGNIESVSTALNVISESSDPVIVLWVSLPNHDNNEIRKQRFNTFKTYVTKQYPLRDDIIFADYMVKEENGDEDFDSIGVSIFSLHLYHHIPKATVHWCTSKEKWENINTTRINTMEKFINKIYDFKITGKDKSREQQLKTIDKQLREKLKLE